MGDKHRPRLSRDRLRSLLLDSGRAIVLDHGLQTQASSLTFKAALDRAEADTGSDSECIDHWPHLERPAGVPAGCSDLLCISRLRSEIDAVVAAISPVLLKSDLSTEESRATALREVCRVGGARHVEALRNSSTFALWIGIWSIAASSDSPTERLELYEALVDEYEAINGHFEDAFEHLMDLLKVQVQKPLTVRQFADAVGALVEGCSLRDRVTEGMTSIMRPTGPNGQMQEWTTFSIGLVALGNKFSSPFRR